MPPPEKSAYTRLSLEKIINAPQAFAVSLVDYQPLPKCVLDSSLAVESSPYFFVLRGALPFSEADYAELVNEGYWVSFVVKL
jgi:hypothetical protein